MSHFALRAAVAGVLMAAGAASASAADLNHYTQAPVTPSIAQVAFNWTGAYVGGNIGANWNNVSLPIGLTGQTGSTTAFTGGLQAGYLWQTNQFVYGLEANVNFDGNSRTFGYTGPAATGPTIPGNAYSQREREDLDFGFRGRLGYAFDRFLPFVSGGVTFADLNSRLTNVTTGRSDSNYQLRTGYSVGGGLEYAVTNNWTVRGEYIFNDYGHYTVNYGNNGFGYRHDVTNNALRFSINYKW
jgi:outer membrane immunogenic protein